MWYRTYPTEMKVRAVAISATATDGMMSASSHFFFCVWDINFLTIKQRFGRDKGYTLEDFSDVWLQFPF